MLTDTVADEVTDDSAAERFGVGLHGMPDIRDPASLAREFHALEKALLRDINKPLRFGRDLPAQTESALPSVPAASAPTEKPTAAPTEAATQPPTEPGPLDLNRATAQELTTLPGIGEVLAQRIVDYREAHGPFRSVEELIAVEGIGEGKLEKLRELVTVEVEP